ncbi:MAG: helix-turn-helix domain-containing protein [Synergistaceae bacterium]|nr:helix-turn-helix domain-containing protein [Synergistaceae bacterium]
MEEIDPMELRMRRLKLGIAADVISRELGFSSSHIARVETGCAKPRKATLTAYAKLLDELEAGTKRLVTSVRSLPLTYPRTRSIQPAMPEQARQDTASQQLPLFKDEDPKLDPLLAGTEPSLETIYALGVLRRSLNINIHVAAREIDTTGAMLLGKELGEQKSTLCEVKKLLEYYARHVAG